MRLIDADKFECFSYDERGNEFDSLTEAYDQGVLFVLEKIDKAPTVEASEVKHGKWIEETKQIKSIAMTPTFVKYYRCSECGRKRYHKEPYCNCGARMDGDDHV